MKVIWFEEACGDYLSWQLQDKKPLNASTDSYKWVHYSPQKQESQCKSGSSDVHMLVKSYCSVGITNRSKTNFLPR